MTGSDYTCFDVEVRDHIASLVMKRPEKANSMILEFWRELPQITDEISSGTDARVVVLSAIGRHFCSGMDLAVFGGFEEPASGGGGHSSRTRAQFRNTALRAQQTFNAFEQSRLPVIAAVQGACVGGGVDMVSACDLRYATQDAFFSIQEINIGMTADVGTLQRMPKLVPEGIVRELAYTGRRMGAQEALDRGFVNAVYDDHASMMEAGRRHCCPDCREEPDGDLGHEAVDELQPRSLGRRRPGVHRHVERRDVRHRRHGRSLPGPRWIAVNLTFPITNPSARVSAPDKACRRYST